MLGAQNANFAPKFPPNWAVSAPNFAFLGDFFPTRRNFSNNFQEKPKI